MVLILAMGKPERGYTRGRVIWWQRWGPKDKMEVLSPVLPLPVSFLICVPTQECSDRVDH